VGEAPGLTHPFVDRSTPFVDGVFPEADESHTIRVVIPARTRVLLVVFSLVAGPIIGLASFALIAFVVPSLAWPLGLLALLAAPAACCYSIGRRFADSGMAAAAGVLAAVSSVVTSVALVIFAFSHASFG
jgi:hypothetical protein